MASPSTDFIGHDSIRYLLRREFPAWTPLARPNAGARAGERELSHWPEGQRAEVARRREELQALSQAELVGLLVKALGQEVNAASAGDRSVDVGPLPLLTRAGTNYWSKLARWKLDEAAALCCGHEPRRLKWERVERLAQESPTANRLLEAREIARRACAADDLVMPNAPGHFIAWAKRTGLPFPADLELLVENQGPIADWHMKYVVEYENLQQARLRIRDLKSELEDCRHPAKPRWPWGTYVTSQLETLAAAVQKFWADRDPDDPEPRAKSDVIVSWLVAQGISAHIAKAMATIIRPDGLKPGPFGKSF